MLQRYLDSLNDLNKRCESFSKFAFVYDNLSIMDRYAHLQRFCEYIEGVHASQIRVKAVILNNPNDEIHVNEYLLIKSTLDNNSKIVTGLRSNAMYKKLFGFLYTGEETSLAVVNQAIQIFDTYINTFEDNKKAISSFGKLEEIKKLVEEISNLVSSIGEVLNLYSKIFKDGTSRYYFSSIEKNINTLSELLNAQEELNYYLNITQAYSILDLYNLKNLISYILNTEDTYKLGSRFSYIYFKNIIDRTFDKLIF